MKKDGVQMNVLEKILEEIDKKADYYESDEQGREHIRMVDMVEVDEIIRSHMDDVNDMNGKRLIDANALDDEVMKFFLTMTGNPKQTTVVRECKKSFRRIIDEQPTVYADDGWIPVSKRLPEDGETVLCTDGEDIFLVEYEADLDAGFGDMDWITAWKPLSEPYRPAEE